MQRRTHRCDHKLARAHLNYEFLFLFKYHARSPFFRDCIPSLFFIFFFGDGEEGFFGSRSRSLSKNAHNRFSGPSS